MVNESYAPEVEAKLREEMSQIMGRYPVARSALLPMLHIIQSVDGYVTSRGIALCAQMLELSRADVSAVATFYSQYRRHPGGDYQVSVCVNPLCAVMGGDVLLETLESHLGIEDGETTPDGKITLQAVECNAACDYAPVVMVNWEFFDNQTPKSVTEIVDKLQKGDSVSPTRGPDKLPTFQENERLLAGFEDGHVNEGLGAGTPSLLGLKIAREQGWTAPIWTDDEEIHTTGAQEEGKE